ncbi:MAG: hypothetical protein WBZ30_02120 [Bradyrhizobium sp.]
MSKAITIAVLTCFLVVGAAAAAILGREAVPAADVAAAVPYPIAEASVPNRESKGDRMIVASIAPDVAAPQSTSAIPNEPLRQALPATPVIEADRPKAVAGEPVAAPKPKPVAKPPVQKSYTLLSDAQITGIKERLKLSPDQESYWPAVENALRAVARKIHATRQADPNGATVPPIDPEAAEVQQLKSAAMPLLFQLREDQKREVRSLARLIGLEKVAAAI